MLKNLLRTIRSSHLVLALLYYSDAACALFFPRRTARTPNKYSIIIASNGNGNIGDQAMLDSILYNTTGQILVVMENRNALKIGSDAQERVRVLVEPNLIRGLPIYRLAATIRFIKILTHASSLAVVGADVMDGKYSPHESTARFSLLNVANIRSVKSMVYGFSWADDAHPFVSKLASKLSKKSFLKLRDPQSLERLKSVGARGQLVSDVVFADDREDFLPDYISNWIISQRSFAIINCSGLIQNRMDQREDYRIISSSLHSLGLSILFLPHVFRAGDDDQKIVSAVYAVSSTENDLLVDTLLSPAQIRRITKAAQLTVTGRMHLAILSLSQRTPAITLSTQGKVGGLYEFFDLPQLVVNPEPGFGAAIQKIVEMISNERDSHDLVSKMHLEAVINLSKKNFSQSEEP